MKMHAIQKILAKHSGRKQVTAGEVIMAKVDFAEINDLYPQTIDSLYDMGGSGFGIPPKRLLCLTTTHPALPSRQPISTPECGALRRKTACSTTLMSTAVSATR